MISVFLPFCVILLFIVFYYFQSASSVPIKKIEESNIGETQNTKPPKENLTTCERTKPPITKTKEEKSEAQLFREAFQWLKSELEISQVNEDSFLNEMFSSFKTGVSENMKETFLKHLPMDKFKWTRFTETFLKSLSCEFLQNKSELEKMELQELLYKMKMNDLREIFKKHFPKIVLGRIKKDELVDKFDLELSAEIKPVLRDTLKNGFIDLLYFEYQKREGEARIQAVIQRLLRKFRCLHRRQQKEAPYVFKSRPYWQIVISDDETTAPFCRQLKGLVRRNTDPFWESHYPPHQDLNCGCEVISLSQSDLEKKHLSLS